MVLFKMGLQFIKIFLHINKVYIIIKMDLIWDFMQQ